MKLRKSTIAAVASSVSLVLMACYGPTPGTKPDPKPAQQVCIKSDRDGIIHSTPCR